MKQRLLLLATVAVLGFTATAVGAPPVANFTDTGTFADSFPDVNACTGDPVQDTVEGHFVVHVTEFADGTLHVAFTNTGTFLLDAYDAAKPDVSGRFTQRESYNLTNRNETGTLSIAGTGKGTDGSTFRIVVTAHFTVNANGEVTVDFYETTCA